MMLALGQFVFSLSTLAYQSLARQSAWRHANNSRVGARSALQFVGPGDDTVNLDGVLLPELTGAGLVTLDPLTDMANRGDAMPLVDGTGVLHGAFVITAISTTAIECETADAPPPALDGGEGRATGAPAA